MTDTHGEALVKVMVKQGKMLTQPHSKLDHDDPDTQTLDENERLEYKEVGANTLESVEEQQVGNKDVMLNCRLHREAIRAAVILTSSLPQRSLPRRARRPTTCSRNS